MHRRCGFDHLSDLGAKGTHMQKPAPNDAPIHELLRNRWSPRAFADQAIPQEVLRSLFVATKEDKVNFEKVLGTLVEFNAGWARSASALAIAVTKLAFTENHTPNRNAQYDTGAATALLSVEATARGLAVHQMAGFDPDSARKTFAIPEGWEPLAAIAIGYPGDPDTLPPKLKERELAPRMRKPIREFVMTGSWGHTAPFAAK